MKRKKPEQRIMKARLTGNTQFYVTEAYKTIRTNLMFSLNKKGCKKIVFTSAVPKEGKSTTCSNLAITLAQTKSRVLLMDCDLRKSVVHKIFKVKGVPGVSDVIGGLCELEEAFRDTEYPNLKVICAGTVPPNPAELLGGEGMEELLSRLETEFDYILIDSPPVNVVSDALSLSKFCDGVVVVVRQEVTLHPELSKALSSLAFVEAKVLGLILNGLEYRGGYYGKYKYYRYNKKYGYEYEYSTGAND